MEDCPECGGELVVGTGHEPSRGVQKVFECNDCGTMYELTEVEQEGRPPSSRRE